MTDFATSKWTADQTCGCASVLWLVTGVSLDKMELEKAKGRGLAGVVKVFVDFIADARPHEHYCVEVEFACARCDSEFTRTYEFEEGDKKARWGYYAEHYGYEDEVKCAPLIGFLDVEGLYEKFEPTDYCYEAAVDFYEEVMKIAEQVSGTRPE